MALWLLAALPVLASDNDTLAKHTNARTTRKAENALQAWAQGKALAQEAKRTNSPAQQKKLSRQALVYLEQVTPTQSPILAEVFLLKGDMYAVEGRYAQALANYDEALLLQPNFTEAYFGRALVRLQTHEVANAQTDLDRTLALAPQHVEAYMLRGALLGKLGRAAQALADFDRVVQLQPNDAEAYFNRALAHFNLAQYEEALADAARANQLGLPEAEALIKQIARKAPH